MYSLFLLHYNESLYHNHLEGHYHHYLSKYFKSLYKDVLFAGDALVNRKLRAEIAYQNQNNEESINSAKKIIKFSLLYNNAIDSDSTNTFHYNCDGIFPTVTVVLDTSGRRFGGFSTQNWSQSPVGGGYSRAPSSFIFNLSQKKKYDLKN